MGPIFPYESQYRHKLTATACAFISKKLLSTEEEGTNGLERPSSWCSSPTPSPSTFQGKADIFSLCFIINSGVYTSGLFQGLELILYAKPTTMPTTELGLNER